MPSYSYPSGSTPSQHHLEVLFIIIIAIIIIIIISIIIWQLDGDDASSSPKAFPMSTCSKSSDGTAQQLEEQGVDHL
jgi:preprotein translocase subunit SecG